MALSFTPGYLYQTGVEASASDMNSVITSMTMSGYDLDLAYNEGSTINVDSQAVRLEMSGTINGLEIYKASGAGTLIDLDGRGTGDFINCNNNDSELFTVDTDGNVVIAGDLDVTGTFSGLDVPLELEGTNGTNGVLTIIDDTSYCPLELINEMDSDVPVYLKLFKDTASPGTSDRTGGLYLYSRNSAAQKVNYQTIVGYSTGVTDGSEQGSLGIFCMEGGASTLQATFGGDTNLTIEGTRGGTPLLHIIDTDDNGGIIIETQRSDDAPAVLQFYHNSESPGNGDETGQLSFYNKNDNGEKTLYGYIQQHSNDVSDGTEDGYFSFHTKVDGANVEVLKIGQTGNPLQFPVGTSDGGIDGGLWRETNTLRFRTGGTSWRMAMATSNTGGTGSAGSGNQYIEIHIDGTTYKVLHDGTV